MGKGHVLKPRKGWPHRRTIILLHDQHGTAQEFAAKLLESESSDNHVLPDIFPTTRWIFPALKYQKATYFDTGLSQRFPQSFDSQLDEDPSELTQIQHDILRENVKKILRLILAETSRISPRSPQRIILGGIGHGCEIAINALLCSDIRLGGFMGFDGWLPDREDISVGRFHLAALDEAITEARVAKGIKLFKGFLKLKKKPAFSGIPMCDAFSALKRNPAVEEVPMFEGIQALEDIPATLVTSASYITDAIFNKDFKTLNVLGDLKWKAAHEDVADTPVFLAHEEDDGLEVDKLGVNIEAKELQVDKLKDDEQAPIRNCEDMEDKLEDLHFRVTVHVYRKGGQWNEPIGMDHIVSFLTGLNG